MNDYRRADEVLDEEGIDDEAQTLVARNPMRGIASEPTTAPARESSDPSDGRDSTVVVRESEIELVREAAPDVDVTRRAEVEQASADRERSTIELRDSEVEGLLADVQEVDDSEVERIDESSSAADPELAQRAEAASGAEAERTDPALSAHRTSGRNEVTERISTIPRTHPFANSIAPTAAPKSVPPAAQRRRATWPLAFAALGLVLLGGGLARLQERFFRSTPEGAQAPAEPIAAAAMPRPEAEPARGEALEPSEPSSGDTELAAAVGEQRRADDSASEESEAPAPKTAAAPSQIPARVAREARRASEEGPAVRRSAQRRERPSAAPADSSGLPAQPPREAVVAVMDSVASELAECAGGLRGIAEVKLTVRSGGQVTYALVDGSFGGTKEGTCMARALRQVRFPAFSEPLVSIRYPFQF